MFHFAFDQQPSNYGPLIYDRYTFLALDQLPTNYEEARKQAALVEDKENDTIRHPDNFLYLALYQDHQQWPLLIVTQRYGPGPEAGFTPGALLIPETSLLFIGAGERLLAYQLNPPAKLWEDSTHVGFWGWERYGEVFIMSAELEIAVWTMRGEKLWATFVEPPWHYTLDKQTIHIEVMGTKASFPLQKGPPTTFRWQ